MDFIALQKAPSLFNIFRRITDGVLYLNTENIEAWLAYHSVKVPTVIYSYVCEYHALPFVLHS